MDALCDERRSAVRRRGAHVRRSGSAPRDGDVQVLRRGRQPRVQAHFGIGRSRGRSLPRDTGRQGTSRRRRSVAQAAPIPGALQDHRPAGADQVRDLGDGIDQRRSPVKADRDVVPERLLREHRIERRAAPTADRRARVEAAPTRGQPSADGAASGCGLGELLPRSDERAAAAFRAGAITARSKDQRDRVPHAHAAL